MRWRDDGYLRHPETSSLPGQSNIYTTTSSFAVGYATAMTSPVTRGHGIAITQSRIETILLYVYYVGAVAGRRVLLVRPPSRPNALERGAPGTIGDV